MATRGEDGVSVGANLRPCTIGTPSVAKYSGDTRATSITRPLSSGPCRSGRKISVAVVVDRERQALGQRRRLDAGNRAHALERAIVELFRAAVVVAEHAHLGRQDGEPAGAEAEVDALRGDQAARQQPADTSSTIVTAICLTTSPSRSVQRRPAACVADDLALQLVHQIRPRRLERRRQPGDQRGEHRDAGVNSSTRTSMLQREGKRNRHRQADRRRQPRQRPGERDAGGGAERRHHHALGEQLLNRAGRGWRRSRGGCRFLSGGPTRARAACSRRWRTQSAARARRRTSGRGRSGGACDPPSDGCARRWSAPC